MARSLKVKLVAPEAVGGNGSATESDSREARSPNVPDVSRLERLPSKFIRFSAVRERTGLSRSTIWRMERRGEFPKHRRISANAVAWVEEEVARWMRSKIEDIAI